MTKSRDYRACLIPTFFLLNTKDYMTHCSSHYYYNYINNNKSYLNVKYLFTMKTLKTIIKETLLLEKRIAQITDNFRVGFAFDISTTQHARDRMTSGRPGISDRVVSNSELVAIMEKYKRDVAEKIILHYILEGDEFVIKDDETGIHLAILALRENDFYWTLLIKTVFQSSPGASLRVAKNQLVISK